MKDIVIFGAGGFGREVAQLIEEINMDKKSWNLLGYIDETTGKQGTTINKNIVLGGVDWLKENMKYDLWTVCAVADPRGKYRIIKRLENYNVRFANLIHPGVKLSKSVELGLGNIICWNTFLSVNTKIGNHIALNPGCGIGHDTEIRDYSSLYWDVTLAGNVCINEGCEIGSKAVVIPRNVVGEWSVIGAGSVVVNDIPGHCVAVGVPAKPIRFLSENWFLRDTTFNFIGKD